VREKYRSFAKKVRLSLAQNSPSPFLRLLSFSIPEFLGVHRQLEEQVRCEHVPQQGIKFSLGAHLCMTVHSFYSLSALNSVVTAFVPINLS
jgi:hypothetical protein